VKLGGVFHQYLGVPVTPRTAAGLSRTIERAVSLQPYVTSVRVRIDPALGGRAGSGRFAYRYLTAEMLDVTVRLRDRGEEVEARLAHRRDLRYPLMSVTRMATRRNVSRSVPRPARRRGRSRRRTSRSAG
jgi:dihydroneopterin aldolase